MTLKLIVAQLQQELFTLRVQVAAESGFATYEANDNRTLGILRVAFREERERDNDLDNSTCGSHEFEKNKPTTKAHITKKESLNASLLRQRAHTREPRRQHVLG